MQNPGDFTDQDVAEFVSSSLSSEEQELEVLDSSPTAPVRCIDCVHIKQRKFCEIKGIKVSRKKLHRCDIFTFREDKSPPPDRYVPANAKEKAKKTRRFMRKLIDAGAHFTEDGHLLFEDFKMGPDGQLYQKQTIEVPQSTATASVVGTEPTEGPTLSDNRENNGPTE